MKGGLSLTQKKDESRFIHLIRDIVSNRRTDITELELTAILVAVKAMFERLGGEDDER